MRCIAFIGVIVAAALAGCSGARLLLTPPSATPPKGSSRTIHGPAYAPDRAVHGAADPASDWSAYNKTLEGNRYSSLAQITRANVGSLRRVCAFQLDQSVNMQSALLAIGGTLYFTTLEDTYAVNATDCRLRWRHTYHLARHPPFDPNQVNRGLGCNCGRRGLYR